MEATIGLGYAHIDYTKYTAEGIDPDGCITCGQKLSSDEMNYWGPTKAGLSIIYTFGTTKKQVVSEQVEIIQPVIPSIPINIMDSVAAPQPQIQHEVGNACILFPVNQYTLLPYFERNSEELAKIDRSINAVRGIQGAKITNITIEAYASPEGDLNHNIELSEKRSAALKDYYGCNLWFRFQFFYRSFKG